MSFFKEGKFRALAIAIVLSLIVLAFWGPFKKGMDIAGGVELTYQIDFSKYRGAYANDTEYQTAIQNAKNIIKNNITKRVNSMGVGDTEVRLLKVGEKDYIVARVGGLTDVEVAKAIIGKTVELEFKVLNDQAPSAEQLAERKKVAEELLTLVVADPDKIKEYGDGKGGDDIYYESIIRTYTQLPQIYQDNIDTLGTLSGVANQLIEGVYGQQQDLSGNVEEVRGFFVVKINSSETTPSSTVTDAKIASINQQFSTTSATSYALNTPVQGTPVATGVSLVGSDLVIAQDEFALAQAYRATVHMVLGMSGVVDTTLVSAITGAIAQGQQPEANSGYITLLDDQWIDLITLQSLQTGLTINSGETLKVLDTDQGVVIISLAQSKSPTDTLQKIITVQGSTEANRTKIVDELTTDKIYNVEHIFIRDRASWKPAMESKAKRVLNGAYFQSAATSQGQTGLPVVTINFNREGADIFCNLTSEIVGQQMAIFVGGKLVTSPTIREKICAGQAQIDGTFTDQTCTDSKDPTITRPAKNTVEGATCLVANLNEGALPAPLILSNEASLTPTLGDHAWTQAMYATALGFALVFLLLWYMYGLTKGIIATVSLLLFLVVTLAFVKITNYALSLSGIAAIILNIGMGVDSSVLILERLKEEMDRGLKLVPAINVAYERSWAPIMDGNIATGLIGFIMALIGSDVFQGFGFMMAINNLILLLITVPITRYLLLWWAESKKNK